MLHKLIRIMHSTTGPSQNIYFEKVLPDLVGVVLIVTVKAFKLLQLQLVF